MKFFSLLIAFQLKHTQKKLRNRRKNNENSIPVFGDMVINKSVAFFICEIVRCEFYGGISASFNSMGLESFLTAFYFLVADTHFG